MNREALAVIKYSLSGGPLPAVSDWDAVVAELKNQAVLPIVGTNNRLMDFDMPKEIRELLKQKVFSTVSFATNLLHTQSELTSFFEAHGATAFVLKGASAGVNYPDPMFRTYGDIDFMLRGKSVEEGVKLMLAEGFITEADISDHYDERHVAFKKNGVTLELHRFFSEKKDKYEQALDEYVESAEIQKDSMLGESFYRLSDIANGLVLLQHINQHIQTGIGIRQFIDWGMYVNRVLDDKLWAESFMETAEAVGLKKLAIYATALCETYLGCESRSYAASADNEVVDRLVDEIGAAGNFGRNRTSGQIHSSAMLNEKNIFTRLHQGGMSHWKAAQKHKALRPFAWLYQCFRLTGMFIAHPGMARGIKEGVEIQKNQDEIFETLGVCKYRGE